MPINFTDAEQRFADSAEGKAAIAFERHKFELGQAHKGQNAMPWTDAMEANVVRQQTVMHARQSVASAAYQVDMDRQIPALREAADAAYRKSVVDLGNAYRGHR